MVGAWPVSWPVALPLTHCPNWPGTVGAQVSKLRPHQSEARLNRDPLVLLESTYTLHATWAHCTHTNCTLYTPHPHHPPRSPQQSPWVALFEPRNSGKADWQACRRDLRRACLLPTYWPRSHRHVYGTAFKREQCHDNVKTANSAWDTNLIKVNPVSSHCLR